MINSNVFSADNNLAASLSNQINKPAITKASYQHASSATTHVTTLTKPFSEILAEVEMLQKMLSIKFVKILNLKTKTLSI